MKTVSALFMMMVSIMVSTPVRAGNHRVVYDNTVNFQDNYYYDIFSNYGCPDPDCRGTALGKEISIDQDEAHITRFRTMLLADPMQSIVNTDVRLGFHTVDPGAEAPGEALWQSEWKRVYLIRRFKNYVTFNVPHVKVPGDFIWTIEFQGPFDVYEKRPKIPIYDPPVVGENLDGAYIFYTQCQCWYFIDTEGFYENLAFYAKIWADLDDAE